MNNDGPEPTAPLPFEFTPSFVLPEAHKLWIDSVIELQDGTIVSCSRDGLKRWSVETGRLLRYYEKNVVFNVIERDDDSIISSVHSITTLLNVWNKTTGECLMSRHTETTTSVVRCNNKNCSDFFVCGLYRGDIEVRRLSDLELVSSFKMHKDSVKCICELLTEDEEVSAHTPSSSSCFFVSGSRYEMICWDVETKAKLWSNSNSHNGWVNHIVQLTGRSMIASAGYQDDQAIKLWKTATGEHVCVLTYAEVVCGMVWLATVEQLVSSSLEGMIRVWNIDDRVCIRTIEAHQDEIPNLTLMRDGASIVTSGVGRLSIRRG